MNKTELIKARNKLFQEVSSFVSKQFKRTLTPGRFKKMYGSSVYPVHQSYKECERRLKQFPSLNLSKMGH